MSDKVRAALVYVVVGIVVVVFITFLISATMASNRIAKDKIFVRDTCLINGYPEYTHSSDTWYCLRRVNGTDELEPLWKFIDGAPQR